MAMRSVVGSSFEIVRMPTNGTQRERLITRPLTLVPTSWSPLNILAFTETHDAINQIWTLSLNDRKPKPFLQLATPVAHPVFSPDGRWIAYSSAESGTQEVYLQAFPGPGEKIPISTNGGNSPAWSADGRELFYQSRIGDQLMRMIAIEIDTRKEVILGKPRSLFDGPYVANSPMRGYDVTPDGEHFVLIQTSTEFVKEQPITHIHVVLNWTEELKRRVPAQ
jgi:Tol biopolymer transport system component